jgi:hypothetical protein
LIEQLLRSNDQSILDELARKQAQTETATMPIRCGQQQSCPPNEACLFDQLHQAYVCVCPREKEFMRVEGVCREYVPNGLSCLLDMGDECSENEECLTLHTNRKHGTCQCKLGYVRNRVNFKCESPRIAEQTISDKRITTRMSSTIQEGQVLISFYFFFVVFILRLN